MVRLIGVVSVNLPYMVLLEYMALGDLRTYLTTHRPNSEFNLTNKPPPTIKVSKIHIDGYLGLVVSYKIGVGFGNFADRIGSDQISIFRTKVKTGSMSILIYIKEAQNCLS